MPYALNLVQCNTTSYTVQRTGLSGFPSGAFDHFLLSMWVCLGPTPYHPRIVGFSNNVVMGGISIDDAKVSILFKPGQSTPASFDGAFGNIPTNVLSHLLVSLSPVAGHVQVYVNDAPLVLTSGGWTGNPVGPFNLGGVCQWSVVAAGSRAPGPGVADVFAAAPSAFYDLTVVANRRRFISRDLTPVDLGTNAASVLGTAPPIYLTARSGVAADFANNNGTGGAFSANGTLGFLAAGSCIAPPPPPPAPRMALDDVNCSTIPHLSSNQVFIDWSDNRGHSYGNPVGQPMGEQGEYLTSCQWQRLGMGRDRVFRIFWSTPTATALQGAWIDATPATS